MSVDKSPVYEVKAVPVEKVYANDYNPNVVAPPEMKLLELSIWEDGFTMPCVCYYNKDEDRYILVDGYVWNIRMISTFRNSKKYPRISECAFVFLRMTMPANIWDSHLQRRR